MSLLIKHSLCSKLYPLFPRMPQRIARRMRALAASHRCAAHSVIYIINSGTRHYLISPLSPLYHIDAEHFCDESSGRNNRDSP